MKKAKKIFFLIYVAIAIGISGYFFINPPTLYEKGGITFENNKVYKYYLLGFLVGGIISYSVFEIIKKKE